MLAWTNLGPRISCWIWEVQFSKIYPNITICFQEECQQLMGALSHFLNKQEVNALLTIALLLHQSNRVCMQKREKHCTKLFVLLLTVAKDFILTYSCFFTLCSQASKFQPFTLFRSLAYGQLLALLQDAKHRVS